MSDRTLPADVVQALLDFATRNDWDIDEVLGKSDVSIQLASAERVRVTEDELSRLARALWRITDDELLGLGPAPLPRGSFRLLCYGLVSATDLREAIGLASGFLAAVPALALSVSIRPDTTRIGLPDAGERDPDHLMPLVGLFASHRLMTWATGAPVPIQRLDVPLPESAHREALTHLFRAPVRYGTPRAALILDTGTLHKPIIRTTKEVDEFVLRAPEGMLSADPYAVTTEERVRRCYETALRNRLTWPTAGQVAGRLGVSPATLRRHLVLEATSLREIASEVRRDAAIVGLVEGNESVAQVAERLGFADAAAFTRAFRRWTDSTPGAYRDRRLPPVGPPVAIGVVNRPA